MVVHPCKPCINCNGTGMALVMGGEPRPCELCALPQEPTRPLSIIPNAKGIDAARIQVRDDCIDALRARLAEQEKRDAELERREREWFNEKGEIVLLDSAEEVRERRKAAALRAAVLERALDVGVATLRGVQAERDAARAALASRDTAWREVLSKLVAVIDSEDGCLVCCSGEAIVDARGEPVRLRHRDGCSLEAARQLLARGEGESQ